MAYKQQDNQSLSEYLAELRRLASTCQWSEEHLAENLRDKFVMGLRNERILQQLLTQDHTKSLDELFQLATTIEAAVLITPEHLHRLQELFDIN